MAKAKRHTSDRSDIERRVGRTQPPLFLFDVLRTRTLNRLRKKNGLVAKCVALVAPVGYGKTVLMAMLHEELRRAGRKCVWFSLDDRDTALDGVVAELDALLRRRDADAHPTQAMFRGQVPLQAGIDELVRRVNARTQPLVIFIDNLQYCDYAPLGRLLDRFLFHTQPAVQFVLTSTRDLPFDAARAQLEGLLRVVGIGELSFDAAEVGKLLGADLRRRLGAAGIEAVVRRTEGWPAAARMAQIVLAGAADPRDALRTFSGSDEALAQLLNRQVLEGFSPTLRDFLLCLAQLRSFCADLCVAATGDAHAREHLAYLVERNVLLVPLDRNRVWYRLHGLLRDHLLHEAQTGLGETRRRGVLANAARWCDKNGYWREAVDYALAGEAFATAVEMLERIAAPFVRDRGDVGQYMRWLESLHERGRRAGPEAEYWFVWALAFQRRYDYARQWAIGLSARVQKLSARRAGQGVSADLRRRVDLLRTSIDCLTDRLDDARAGAERWNHDATATDDPFDMTVVHCIESCCATNALRFDAARRALHAARESAYRARSAYVDGWVWCFTALAAMGEGGYIGIHEDFPAAFGAVRAALGEDAGICGTMALVGARCAVGMGLAAQARDLVASGLATAQTHGFLDAAACGLEAAVLIWADKREDVVDLQTLREVAAAYPPRLSQMLSCWLVRRFIRLGRIDEAQAESLRSGVMAGARARRTPEYSLFDALVASTKIELLIATHHDERAARLLAPELRRAKSAGCMARLVELELDGATLALRADDARGATRHVARALLVAAPRRIVRPFDDHIDLLARIVAETKPAAWGFITDEERQFFAEICRKLPAGGASAPTAAFGPGEARTLAPLTPRERELLGFIELGLSNAQLADRAATSVNTIKWHLQNLYGKLGVASRSAALARARAVNLLDR